MDRSVLWRRLDRPGHEACRLTRTAGGWLLAGSAVFAHEESACRLDYAIATDAGWITTSGRVEGWIGSREVAVEIAVDSSRRWRMNGRLVPEVEGCLDIDLNFSPSTNLLPIRRLSLGVGEEAGLRAAWLRFPGFTLEPLDQTYRRSAAGVYRYESAGGRFVADIDVDDAGLPVRYPGLCEREDGGGRR